ncbi:MYG1 family protein [Dyadobacter beijingensis]|nr:MYG1 family protein [Dyadobacter beijingensis]
MNFHTVVTHDTTFHADDVFAVAMLTQFHAGFNLIRTRDENILNYALLDPQIVVLDVGGQYEPEKLNFDHHQDTALPSAASLIYQHFNDRICPKPAQPYFEEFVSVIDLLDTNRGNIYGQLDALPAGFRTVDNLIKGFNRDVTDPTQQDKQFRLAVDFAVDIVKNEKHFALLRNRLETDYRRREILPNNVALLTEYHPDWKTKKDHVFAVMPHANGWQIQSRDTTIDKVPETISKCNGFIFRHGSGFMAVVKDRQVAVEFASSLTRHQPFLE